MPDQSQLLALLYGAHRDLRTMFLELSDCAEPLAVRRRVWFEPPDRVRIEVMHGPTTIRVGVRNGDSWWRWDADDGESAGDLAQGAPLPALLDLHLLEPARLLSTTWFEVIGTGRRASRDVLQARGTPRRNSDGVERRLEFEFDLEHGTPLHVSTFESGEQVNLTETISVEYGLSIDPTVFVFDADRASGATPSNRQTVWLTGLSGAGKTTIARATERLLHQLGIRSCVLDGDQLRQGLSSDLGLSRDDRREQSRRVAHVATIIAASGVVPIVALVSPYVEDRRLAREVHDSKGVGFLEVWVNTPIEVCAARDPKGLYARAGAANSAPVGGPAEEGSGLTGVSSPYEAPARPDLQVSGTDQPAPVSATQIVERLLAKSDETRLFAIN